MDVKHENVLSRTEVAHLEDLENLYISYVEKPKDFHLTTLQRIASKKTVIEQGKSFYKT